MPDFGALSIPNFAATATAGYQAGQAIGKERRLSAALAGYDPAKPETAIGILREDPGMGIGLLNASTQLATAHREAAGREALGTYLLGRLAPGAKGGDPASGVTQGGTVSPGSPAATSQDGDIVVTAQAPQPSAEEALIRADPHAWLSVQDNLSKLDDNHRKAIADAASAQGSVAVSASQLPYEARKAFIAQQAPFLKAHGVTDAEIAAFDPTDANLQAQRDQALGVEGVLKQQNTEADDARQDRNVDSEIASRGLRDTIAQHGDTRDAARLGLAYHADARADRADARAAARASGEGGGSGKATPPSTSRTVVLGGKTYAKVGGKWIAK